MTASEQRVGFKSPTKVQSVVFLLSALLVYLAVSSQFLGHCLTALLSQALIGQGLFTSSLRDYLLLKNLQLNYMLTPNSFGIPFCRACILVVSVITPHQLY